MQSSISVVINELNQSKKVKNDTPVSNIVEILNMHLSCLEWIEERNNTLEEKIQQLSNVYESIDKIHER
jgi:hypothetical protein